VRRSICIKLCVANDPNPYQALACFLQSTNVSSSASNKIACAGCSSNLQETTRYPQLYVYDICLTKFGEYHKWMAFLEVDEFLVLQPEAGARKLPEFLQDFNDYGGLVANMRVFGSSGFKSRPQGSILRNYLK
jgi:hypothetical protein